MMIWDLANRHEKWHSYLLAKRTNALALTISTDRTCTHYFHFVEIKVSFAEYRLFYRALSQKRPIIFSLFDLYWLGGGAHVRSVFPSLAHALSISTVRTCAHYFHGSRLHSLMPSVLCVHGPVWCVQRVVVCAWACVMCATCCCVCMGLCGSWNKCHVVTSVMTHMVDLNACACACVFSFTQWLLRLCLRLCLRLRLRLRLRRRLRLCPC